MTDWPFGALRPLSYATILCDPPWAFANYSAKGERKNPNQHYPCMALADIQALPVGQLAGKDAACIMWATSPLLDRAIETLKGWGFAYKGAGAWAKMTPNMGHWSFGTGYIYRSAAEFFLVGTIGKPKRTSRSIRNLIVASTREHSQKPEQMHRDLELLFPGPYCELFARQRRPGWEVWGNDVDHFEEKP